MSKLEITYVNQNGEILTLKVLNKRVFFNHSDVHEHDFDFEDIKRTDAIFSEDEKIVISKFSRLTNDLKEYIK